MAPFLVLGLARLRVGHRRLGEDGEDLRETPVGNPDLGSVEDVVLAVRGELGARADGAGVAAGTRLREGERGHVLARDESRKVALLLLLIACDETEHVSRNSFAGWCASFADPGGLLL